MNRKLNKKQVPLFYINQPNIKLPELNMQDRYVFKNGVEDSVEPGATNEMEVKDTSKLTEANGVESSQDKKKTSFNDLPLDEKIKHLKMVPASIAKVRYEFITAERTFKGYFLDMKDNALIIHSTSPRRKNAAIPLEDLLDIKRIGL